MQNKLEVNRDLINNNFESYRYNRDIKYNLLSNHFPNDEKLHTFKLNPSDYSYCHASMASIINNLYQSKFVPDKVYFISDSGSVFCSFLKNDENGLTNKMISIFTIPCKYICSQFDLFFTYCLYLQVLRHN